jgi:hypothetical protein
MSVTFFVVGEPPHCQLDDGSCYDCRLRSLNLSNVNARVLLEFVGLADTVDSGRARARELARRIHAVRKMAALDIPESKQHAGLVEFRRHVTHYENRLAELLELCIRAGDLGVIAWA